MEYNVEIKEFKPQRTAAVRAKTTINKVTEKVVQLLGETADYLKAQGIEPTGPSFGVYYEVGSVVVDVEAGYPVDVKIKGNDRVHAGELPGVKAAVASYTGPHAKIPEAHRAVHAWMHQHAVEASGDPPREVYLTDLRLLGPDEECTAQSVWPIIVEPSRAERRRQERANKK